MKKFLLASAAVFLTVLAPLQAHSAPVGTFDTTLPTLLTGNPTSFHFTNRGELLVAPSVASVQAGITLNAGVTALSNNVAGQYSIPYTRIYNGATWDAALSANGSLSSPGKGLATEEVGRLFNHQNTNTTFTVKSGAGFLHNLFVGTPGTGETVTCYDSLTATGTMITTFTPTNAGPNILDIAFTTGLTCVTAGTTAGDYTFAYR